MTTLPTLTTTYRWRIWQRPPDPRSSCPRATAATEADPQKLRTETPWQRYRNVVLVHAVRYARELAYRDLIREILREKPKQFRYLTLVSREPAPGSLAGRIPAALRDGRLEAAAGLPLGVETSQVLLCGNPAMLKDMTAALAERGMRKHRRRSPGQITAESFW